MRKFIPSWTYEYDILKNREEYLDLVNKVFDSGRLLFGEQLEALQESFSNYIGTKNAVCCDNATNGLFLSLKSLGISSGDYVVTVPNTAIPTVSAIRQAGGIPKFVDVDEYALLDVTKLEAVLDPQVKAIIPVHLYGYPCDMKNICRIAEKYSIPVIEDCSQAHGSSIEGKKVGSFGDLSVFSFYPTKSLGAFGDAGIICTSNLELYEKLTKLRFYGIEKNYVADIDGYNSRIDEIQAGFLNLKLERLDANIEHRNKIRDLYENNIHNKKLKLLPKPENSLISNYLIPFLYEGDRDLFQEKLFEEGNIFTVKKSKKVYQIIGIINFVFSEMNILLTNP